MHGVKWEAVQLTGFKVFKWNERLVRNNIPEEEGLFVIRQHDGSVKRVFQFNLFTMVDQVPDPCTGNFLPRLDGLAFTTVLNRSHLFNEVNQLVDELNSFLQTFFEFSGFTVNCPYSPRLVFIVDFSYNPFLYLPYPDQSSPTTDIDTHIRQEEEQAEGDAIDMYASDVNDINNDDGEVDFGERRATDDADVEAEYTDEMEEIVAQLRVFSGVGRTYPIMPLSQGDPTGLVQAEMPLVEMFARFA